jgi:hypothetical protein
MVVLQKPFFAIIDQKSLSAIVIQEHGVFTAGKILQGQCFL